MVSEYHLATLRRGIPAWNAWCAADRSVTPDLSGHRWGSPCSVPISRARSWAKQSSGQPTWPERNAIASTTTAQRYYQASSLTGLSSSMPVSARHRNLAQGRTPQAGEPAIGDAALGHRAASPPRRYHMHSARRIVAVLSLALLLTLLAADHIGWTQPNCYIAGFAHPFDVVQTPVCSPFGCKSVRQQIPCQHPVWRCR